MLLLLLLLLLLCSCLSYKSSLYPIIEATLTAILSVGIIHQSVICSYNTPIVIFYLGGPMFKKRVDLEKSKLTILSEKTL